MSWRERIGGAAERIARAGSDAPREEARELFRHALGLDRRAFLLLDETFEPEAPALVRFDALVARRVAHEPLQYLLGGVPFCEIELEVGPGALIPRPETEVLVERVTARLREAGWTDRGERGRSPFPGGAGRGSHRTTGEDAEEGSGRPVSRPDPPAWILDVGTGTGAILLALLARFPALRGIGIDVSADALAIASRNAGRLVREGRIARGRAGLVRGRWLDAVGRPSAPIAAIVSNPPYVPSRQVGSLAPEIRGHEPLVALDGGKDGLDFLGPLCDGALRLLPPGGLLALELAFDQPDRVAATLTDRGLEPIEIYRDLAGRPRGVVARRE